MSHFLRPLLATGCGPSRLVNARTGGTVAAAVEPAFDSTARRRGLLGRDGLPAGAALVIAPCAAVHTCFMRFPIDVLFVTRDGCVRKMVSSLGAWRVAASLRAFAVVEMAAGSLAGVDLRPGDRLLVEPVCR